MNFNFNHPLVMEKSIAKLITIFESKHKVKVAFRLNAIKTNPENNSVLNILKVVSKIPFIELYLYSTNDLKYSAEEYVWCKEHDIILKDIIYIVTNDINLVLDDRAGLQQTYLELKTLLNYILEKENYGKLK